MRTTLSALFCLAALLAVAPSAQAQAGEYRVIVNRSNPTSAIRKDQLAQVYLKKVTVWDHGASVVVVDQSERSAVRAQFSRAVLGRDVPTIKNYWQQSLFSGRGVPPVEQPSDMQVIRFVASNPNAIGYVSASTDLPADVKTISVVR